MLINLPELTTSAAFQTARAALHDTDALTVQHMCEATMIAAPSGAEAVRAQWFAQRLRELGLEPQVDEVGNVFATSPAREPSAEHLVIASHLDTVFPADTRLEIVRHNGRLCAPGISDNSRGIAGLLALARALRAAAWPVRIPITFLATVGEEGAGDLRGVKHFVATRGDTIGAFIALDGAGAARVIAAGVGSRRLRVTFRGPGGHSWSDHARPSAIDAAAHATTALRALELQTEPRTTLSVGRIGGGTSINAIAAEAWLELDLRSEARELLLDLEERVRAQLHASAATTSNTLGTITCDIEVFGDRPAGRTAEDSAIVRAACTATCEIGAAPEITSSSTDANVPMAAGIPAIAIGAGGDAGGTHTLDEWYSNEDGVRGLERALMIVLALAT